MRNVRKKTRKTTKTQHTPERSSKDSGLEVVRSLSSSSPLAEIYSSAEFQLEWDNNVAHHVAASVLHLRRFRRYSQARVAKLMGTGQGKVARIEAGDENITLRTLKRLIIALDGRLRLAIEPKEVMVPRVPQWWEAASIGLQSNCAWRLKAVLVDDSRPQQRAVAGWVADSKAQIPVATSAVQQLQASDYVSDAALDIG